MLFGFKDVFAYFQCSRCSCLQIEAIPPDMSKYYPDHYYSFKPVMRPRGWKRYLINRRNAYGLYGRGWLGGLLFRRYPRTNLNWFRHFQPDKKSKILDVGCGSGDLLFMLRGLGFKNLTGVDPFIPEDIDYGRGLKIEKRRIQDVEGTYDLVMFHDSLEHFPDPAGALKVASRLLGPGGCCLIAVPVVSSYAWKHYGVDWVALDAPRHFFLHSIDSLTILAGQAGLSVRRTIDDSTAYQFWGSEQFRRGIPIHDCKSRFTDFKSSLFSKSEIAAFEKRAEELNKNRQGDHVLFDLRKF